MTESTTPAPIYLNHNETLPVRLAEGALVIDLGSADTKRFWENVSPATQLRVTTGDHTRLIAPRLDAASKTLHFPLADLPRGAPLQVMLRGQPIAEFSITPGAAPTLHATANHPFYQLIVDETRGLSHPLNDPAPLSPPYDRAARMGFDAATHAPITDLHTHSSAQLRPRDLFDIALGLDKAALHAADFVTYPVELLKKLEEPGPRGEPPEVPPGTADKQKQHSVKSIEFTPMKSEGLACEQGGGTQCEAVRLKDLTQAQRDALIRKMDSSEDLTKSFQAVERDIYRYSNPLTKNAKATKLMLRAIAEDYAKNGIQYAELATGSVLNPAWFQAMVEAVDAIEHGTLKPDGTRAADAITVGPQKKPFRMRFLVGLPRNKSPEETMDILERTKFLLRHHLIVGIDLMGNEMNGTRDFHWALSHMAQWARQHDKHCIIRVHAGETAKNPESVSDVVRIAHEHQVRARVGHGQNATLSAQDNGWLRFMREKAGQLNPLTGLHWPTDWFGWEACSASNVFYQMWPLPHQVKIRDAELGHSFLGSDGNGMMHTSPIQTAFSALTTGRTLEDLAAMRANEERYIGNQFGRDADKIAAFDARHPGGNAEFFDAYRKFTPMAEIEKRFEGKIPILIGGASGSSWHGLGERDQRMIEQMMVHLLEVIDPEKYYFVLGRVQNEGVSKALDTVVKQHNFQHPDRRFAVRARIAGIKGAPIGDLPESVSGVEYIGSNIEDVPDAMMKDVHENNGFALFFGGGQFTGDMVLSAQSESKPVPYAVFMPEGSEVAGRVGAITPPEHRIAAPADLFRVLEGFLGTVEHVAAGVGGHGVHASRSWCERACQCDGAESSLGRY